MKPTQPLFSCLAALVLLPFLSVAEENGETDFVYEVGEVNYFTGEGVNAGGFLFPELFVTGGGGIFENGASAEDFANTHHDPQNDWTVQGVEAHLNINIHDTITGMVTGFGHLGEDHVWEAELEEAYLHYRPVDWLAIGGGQFLNEFGFQASKHLHGWDHVNRDLVITRMLNEGELISQGGEAIVTFPNHSRLTIAAGGLRTHGHDHEHEHEEEEHHDEDEDHDEDHEEEHHLEGHDGAFNNWVVSVDYRFRLPVDPSVVLSASLASGENGFGQNTTVYGVGAQKVWNGHDHGQGGPDFCAGALMWRTELIGRDVEAVEEDGEAVEFDDFGFSTGLYYGLSDATTLSVRHGYISEVEMAELPGVHRTSAALTTFLDPASRVRARVQYDHTQSDAIESEHALWLQLQWQWGGHGGGHHHHHH